jgi:uroporphyrinogen decarboxylase
MNSRERVRAALAHREPDRVPRDLGATPSSGISAIAYNRLVRHLGLAAGPARVYDVVQQLAQPEECVLERFGIDVLDVGRTFDTAAGDWYPITLADGSAACYPAWFRPRRKDDGGWVAHGADGTPLAEMPEGATFFDQVCFPYVDGYPADWSGLDRAMGQVLWAAFVHSPWDHAADPGFWETLRANAIRLRETTDKALMIVAGCNLFEWGTFLRRMDNFLMDLVAEPAKVEALLDALVERHLAGLARVCRAVGDVVDVIRLGDDLGMDKGPFMAPAIYRKLFRPRHKVMCDFIKRNSAMRILLHSCGGIRPLIPDLIEAGFDILNPVQTSCRGMVPAELKKEFGGAVAFWGGGCDTRQVLPRGTPAEVKADVRARLEAFAPGGGFVFNTVHNILPDVPPENVVAMFEALETFGVG